MSTGVHPVRIRPRAGILAVSVAIAAAGVALPVKRSEALFGGFNPFNPFSYVDLMKDMMESMAGFAGDVFVGSMKIAGKTVKVMLNFAEMAMGVMAVPPFDFAKDGMARMFEISMRVAREMMRQDPGLMEFMTIWGFKGYEMMANMFPGQLEDEILGEMFELMLESDMLTEEMLWYTKRNEGLARLMNRIAGKNRSLRHKLVAKMAKDKGMAADVLDLAIKFPFLTDTLCGKMDDTSFRDFSRVIADSTGNARRVGTIFSRICKSNPDEPPPMLVVMRHLGSKTDHNDGNETADERTIYGMFRDLVAADRFMDGVERLEPEIQIMMFNTLFLGEAEDGIHRYQAFFNAYAMARGMLESILPHYDFDLPPDPESENPANALVGRMIPLLVDMQDPEHPKLTDWGWQFVQGLMSGAMIHGDEPSAAVLDFLGRLMPPMDMPGPDASSPAPRDFGARIGKARASSESRRDQRIQAVQFGYDYLHQPLYSKGSDDAWLFMPEWIAPATWYRTDNGKRKVDSTKVYTELALDPAKENLVFLVVPFDSSYPTWALADGFTPIYGERFESEDQTGFRLFGRRVPKGTARIRLMGNGEGSHNYVFAVMEESADNVYANARQRIEEAALLNREANWLYTLNHKEKDPHFHDRLLQGKVLGEWGADDGDGWDVRGIEGGRLWLHAAQGHEDIVKVLSLGNDATRRHFVHQGARVRVDAPPGYTVIGWFDSDGDARDSYGNKGNPYIAIAVKHGYEDYVKLATLGGKVKRYEVLPGYRPVGWWKVDGDSMDSFGRRTKEGWISLQIRPLDDDAGKIDKAAWEPGLNFAAWYTDRHLRIGDVAGGYRLMENYVLRDGSHYHFREAGALVLPDPDLLEAWIRRGRPGVRSGRRHPENPLEMAAYLYLNAGEPDNYMGRHVIDAIHKEKDDGKYRNPFGDDRRFVMRINGRIEVPETGDYVFGVDGDNPVEVRIDGRRVTGWYGSHGNKDEARELRTIRLERGYHHVEFIGEDLYDFTLYWKLPSMGEDEDPVPVSDQRLSHPRFDGDMDGVPDAFDLCPDSKPGIPVERHGCHPYRRPYRPVEGDGFGGSPLPVPLPIVAPSPDAGSDAPPASGPETSGNGAPSGGEASGDGDRTGTGGDAATPTPSLPWLVGWTAEPDGKQAAAPDGFIEVGRIAPNVKSGEAFDAKGRSARRMLTFALDERTRRLHGEIVRLVNVARRRGQIPAAGERTLVVAEDGYSVRAFLRMDGDRAWDRYGTKDDVTTLQVKKGYEPYVRLVRLPKPEAAPANGWLQVARWKLRKSGGIDSNGAPLMKGDWVGLQVRPLPANAGAHTGGEYENGLRLAVWKFKASWNPDKQRIENKVRHPASSEGFDRTLAANVADRNRLQGVFKLLRIENAGARALHNPFGDDSSYLTWLAGRLKAPASGTYRFALDGDDAVELRIDGKVVASWLGGHKMAGKPMHAVTLYLEKGLHSVQFLHEEKSDRQGFRLYWKTPGSDRFVVVPWSAFSHARHDADLDGIADLHDACPDTLPGSGAIRLDGCAVPAD